MYLTVKIKDLNRASQFYAQKIANAMDDVDYEIEHADSGHATVTLVDIMPDTLQVYIAAFDEMATTVPSMKPMNLSTLEVTITKVETTPYTTESLREMVAYND